MSHIEDRHSCSHAVSTLSATTRLTETTTTDAAITENMEIIQEERIAQARGLQHRQIRGVMHACICMTDLSQQE